MFPGSDRVKGNQYSGRNGGEPNPPDTTMNGSALHGRTYNPVTSRRVVQTVNKTQPVTPQMEILEHSIPFHSPSSMTSRLNCSTSSDTMMSDVQSDVCSILTENTGDVSTSSLFEMSRARQQQQQQKQQHMGHGINQLSKREAAHYRQRQIRRGGRRGGRMVEHADRRVTNTTTQDTNGRPHMHSSISSTSHDYSSGSNRTQAGLAAHTTSHVPRTRDARSSPTNRSDTSSSLVSPGTSLLSNSHSFSSTNPMRSRSSSMVSESVRSCSVTLMSELLLRHKEIQSRSKPLAMAGAAASSSSSERRRNAPAHIPSTAHAPTATSETEERGGVHCPGKGDGMRSSTTTDTTTTLTRSDSGGYHDACVAHGSSDALSAPITSKDPIRSSNSNNINSSGTTTTTKPKQDGGTSLAKEHSVTKAMPNSDDIQHQTDSNRTDSNYYNHNTMSSSNSNSMSHDKGDNRVRKKADLPRVDRRKARSSLDSFTCAMMPLPSDDVRGHVLAKLDCTNLTSTYPSGGTLSYMTTSTTTAAAPAGAAAKRKPSPPSSLHAAARLARRPKAVMDGKRKTNSQYLTEASTTRSSQPQPPSTSSSGGPAKDDTRQSTSSTSLPLLLVRDSRTHSTMMDTPAQEPHSPSHHVTPSQSLQDTCKATRTAATHAAGRGKWHSKTPASARGWVRAGESSSSSSSAAAAAAAMASVSAPVSVAESRLGGLLSHRKPASHSLSHDITTTISTRTSPHLSPRAGGAGVERSSTVASGERVMTQERVRGAATGEAAMTLSLAASLSDAATRRLALTSREAKRTTAAVAAANANADVHAAAPSVVSHRQTHKEAPPSPPYLPAREPRQVWQSLTLEETTAAAAATAIGRGVGEGHSPLLPPTHTLSPSTENTTMAAEASISSSTAVHTRLAATAEGLAPVVSTTSAFANEAVQPSTTLPSTTTVTAVEATEAVSLPWTHALILPTPSPHVPETVGADTTNAPPVRDEEASSALCGEPVAASASASASASSTTLAATHTPYGVFDETTVTKLERIGRGSYGAVFRAQENATGRILAVKEVLIPMDYTRDFEKQLTTLQREIMVMRKLHHSHIIAYYGASHSDLCLNIYMEYVGGGTMAKRFKQEGPCSEAECRYYTAQLLQGLEYLHQSNIVHRDLKGDNIFLTEDNTLKVGDFGTSKELVTSLVTDTVAGTPNFMAPEVISCSGHSYEADIWSVGCCVLEMLTGEPPMSRFDNNMAIMFGVVRGKFEEQIPESISPGARSFIRACTHMNAKERWTATQLRTHPWLVGDDDAENSGGGGVCVQTVETNGAHAQDGALVEGREKSAQPTPNAAADVCVNTANDTVSHTHPVSQYSPNDNNNSNSDNSNHSNHSRRRRRYHSRTSRRDGSSRPTGGEASQPLVSRAEASKGSRVSGGGGGSSSGNESSARSRARGAAAESKRGGASQRRGAAPPSRSPLDEPQEAKKQVKLVVLSQEGSRSSQHLSLSPPANNLWTTLPKQPQPSQQQQQQLQLQQSCISSSAHAAQPHSSSLPPPSTQLSLSCTMGALLDPPAIVLHRITTPPLTQPERVGSLAGMSSLATPSLPSLSFGGPAGGGGGHVLLLRESAPPPAAATQLKMLDCLTPTMEMASSVSGASAHWHSTDTPPSKNAPKVPTPASRKHTKSTQSQVQVQPHALQALQTSQSLQAQALQQPSPPLTLLLQQPNQPRLPFSAPGSHMSSPREALSVAREAAVTCLHAPMGHGTLFSSGMYTEATMGRTGAGAESVDAVTLEVDGHDLALLTRPPVTSYDAAAATAAAHRGDHSSGGWAGEMTEGGVTRGPRMGAWPPPSTPHSSPAGGFTTSASASAQHAHNSCREDNEEEEEEKRSEVHRQDRRVGGGTAATGCVMHASVDDVTLVEPSVGDEGEEEEEVMVSRRQASRPRGSRPSPASPPPPPPPPGPGCRLSGSWSCARAECVQERGIPAPLQDTQEGDESSTNRVAGITRHGHTRHSGGMSSDGIIVSAASPSSVSTHTNTNTRMTESLRQGSNPPLFAHKTRAGDDTDAPVTASHVREREKKRGSRNRALHAMSLPNDVTLRVPVHKHGWRLPSLALSHLPAGGKTPGGGRGQGA